MRRHGGCNADGTHLAAQDLNVSDTHVALSAERKGGGCYVMVAFELTVISDENWFMWEGTCPAGWKRGGCCSAQRACNCSVNR